MRYDRYSRRAIPLFNSPDRKRQRLIGQLTVANLPEGVPACKLKLGLEWHLDCRMETPRLARAAFGAP
jgi:hypothetical protein